MKGFFSIGEISSTPTTIKRLGCPSCGLYKKCHSPKMEPSGKGHKEILIIGEANGKTDDLTGTHFVGESGDFLRKRLRIHGIDLDRDCWKTNALSCYPPKSRSPKPAEIEACRPKIWQAVKELNPKLILLCGTDAVHSFYGHRWRHDPLDGIQRWRGWRIPDRDAQAWVCPIYHPTQLIRAEGSKGGPQGVAKVFDLDLTAALKQLEVPLPASPVREEDCVKVVTDEKELNGWLVWLLKHYETEKYRPLCVIDLETTGLKPHREGHAIATCAISWDPDEAIAFPWPKGEHPRRRLHRLFHHPEIKKVAQNLPFEDAWLSHFGFPVQNWYWDTLLASHTLDNRPKISGLKFQGLVQFGVLGYDDAIGGFLKATSVEEKEYGSNAINRVFEAPQDKLLLYDGMDTIITHRLALRQIAIMKALDTP